MPAKLVRPNTEIPEKRRKLIELVARWLLSLIFLFSAVGTLRDFRNTAADLAAKHIPWASVTLGIALTAETAGALALISGIQLRWGATILLLFVLPATATHHAFWLYEGGRRDAQEIHSLKNLAIIGGLLLIIARITPPLHSKGAG